MTIKELQKEIRWQIREGVTKKEIWERYRMTEYEIYVRRYLPTQVSLAKRRQWKILNCWLVACLIVLTVFKCVNMLGVAESLPSAPAGVIGFFLFGLAVNVAVIIGIARFVGIAYLILFCFMLRGVVIVVEDIGKLGAFEIGFATAYLLVYCVFLLVTLVLGLVLYHKLLPNTTFWLQAKKDACGNPIFDD